MIDIRSTKGGLSGTAGSIREFRQATCVRTIGSFQSALDAGFSEWLGRHWQFLGTRLFQPIRLDFRQPRDTFLTVPDPERPEVRPFHYAFFSSIQLTFPLTSISNMRLATSAANFQSWPSSVTQHTSNVEKTQTNVFAGQFWSSLFQFRNQRRANEPGVVRETTSLLKSTERLFGALAGILRSRPDSEQPSRSATPLFITMPHTRERELQVRETGARQLWLGQSTPEKRGAGRAVIPERMAVFLRSLFDSSSLSRTVISLQTFLKTVRTDQTVNERQLFLKQLLVSNFPDRLSSPERSFTNVAQKFAAPKVAGPEQTARQIQYFGPAPDLKYAKNESPQLQGVVNALRGLPAAQSETRAAAPALPSIAQLTSQVRQELERELKIERERRGL